MHGARGATLLRQWAKWMQAGGASDKTVNTRLSGIRSLCAHAGRTDPVSIATMEIVEWLADYPNPWTRRTYYTSVREWCRWLVEQGEREDDPTGRLHAPPEPRGLPRPASSRALEATLEVAPRRARAYILLAAYEGLRVHEVAKVAGEDFQEGWLHVNGKGGRERWVPVHPLVASLQVGWPVEGWWFPSARSRSGHVTPNSVSHTISKTFRAAGYPVTAHQLRHWFGTHTQRNSHDVRVTQELLGHASSATTQIYTEVANRAKQQAVWLLSGSGRA